MLHGPSEDPSVCWCSHHWASGHDSQEPIHPSCQVLDPLLPRIFAKKKNYKSNLHTVHNHMLPTSFKFLTTLTLFIILKYAFYSSDGSENNYP